MDTCSHRLDSSKSRRTTAATVNLLGTPSFKCYLGLQPLVPVLFTTGAIPPIFARLTIADDQNGAGAECLVDARCLDWDHCQRLNLLQLAAQGHLNAPLIGSPLVCEMWITTLSGDGLRAFLSDVIGCGGGVTLLPNSWIGG
jgi:hypothetical protein